MSKIQKIKLMWYNLVWSTGGGSIVELWSDKKWPLACKVWWEYFTLKNYLDSKFLPSPSSAFEANRTQSPVS